MSNEMKFLTDRNQNERPHNSHRIVQADGLWGLKFNFTAEGIQSWLPIYDNASAKLETRFPWYHKGIQSDCGLLPTNTVTHEYFDDAENRKVDAIKGYINKDGNFCGLLFRRNGEWSENIFGEMSAYEITVELGEGERISSAYISGTSALSVSAHAFIP